MNPPNTTGPDSTPLLSRRSMLRTSALGMAGVAIATYTPAARAMGAVGTTTVPSTGDALRLTMRACLVEMVDETRVPMWAFDSAEAGLRVPGPIIYAQQGRPVDIDVVNRLERHHAFAIPGVVDSGPIAPGETRRVSFDAPAAGTYVYLDPMNAPVHRAMGLAGPLVVLPAVATTPYDDPTPSVTNLFDDLGTAEHFPGRPWDPARTWVWAFSSIDPVAHARVADDADLTGDEFRAMYHPRYFLLNGKSGYFACHDPATTPYGRVGQPALLRIVNLGMAFHSPHVHGNHAYVLFDKGRVQDNVIGRDTWAMPPLAVTDVLLPFVRPPDAHPWPPSDPGVFARDLAGTGTTGMTYPIHCHAELSLLANGANYPQGLVSHWALTGDVEAESPPDPPAAEPPTPGDETAPPGGTPPTPPADDTADPPTPGPAPSPPPGPGPLPPSGPPPRAQRGTVRLVDPDRLARLRELWRGGRR